MALNLCYASLPRWRFAPTNIVTDTHVIEVEWAENWYESVGQSLWYAFQLDRGEEPKRPVFDFMLKLPERFLTIAKTAL